MADDARVDAGAAAYRGFLFSDMRGFTAFGERYGNAAAAAMVSRFLEIARTAIARYEGAEIKTEGDAIFAVFPSASGAVMCGLDMVDAAAELNARQVDRPLGIGVGVHAGEAVETAEGYIGRAVNIAARLCAVARPGEVLVSSTVKGITQASIQIGFIPRGRRRLKGIADPVLVYAVSRDMHARARREVPRAAVLGVVIAAVAAVAVFTGISLLSNPGASPSPTAATAAPTVRPVVVGPLDIGTWRSREFVPPITFDIGDLDWSANRDGPSILGLVRGVSPRGSLYFLRVQEVIANPCVEGAEGAQTGPSSSDLLTQLQALPHLTLTNHGPIQVGGFAGTRVDIVVSEGALAACGGVVGGEVALFLAGEEVWRASPGERFRLASIGVGDQSVTILLGTDWTQTPSIQDIESMLEVGERVIDSVRFPPPA